MEFRILGPVAVVDGDRSVALGGVKQRSLLVLLLLHRNAPISTARLVDELWGEQPPPTAAKTVQVYVSQLRKLVGDGKIETHGHGYALRVEPGELDLDRFQALLERALEEEPRAAASTLREALSLFRGEPLQDVAYESWAQTEIARLDELRLAAVEQLAEADLALGRHVQLVPELGALLREHPLREGLRARLMLALYRSGRQAEALEAYRAGRLALDEELGLEPGPELRELEQRILRQDPVLAAPAVPLATRTRRRRGLLLLLAGAALLLAASLALAALELTREPTSGIASVGPNSVAAIDPSTDRVVAEIPVGAGPAGVVPGNGALWVASLDDGTVSRIDLKAHLVTQTIPLEGLPSGLASGEGAVWVASSDERSLRRIVPGGARLSDPIDVGNGASGVAAGRGAIWVANRLDDTVSKVPLRREAVQVFRAGLTPSGVAVGEDAVWVSNEAAGTVSRLDPSRGVVQAINVGNGPAGIAVAPGAVWVANSLDDTVSRIDPGSNAVAATIRVGVGPTAVAFGAGSIWVANQFSGTVSRIDPTSNRVIRTIQVGESLGGIAFAGGRIWVSARGPLTSHRGGVLRVSVSADSIDAVDPSVAYTPLSWSIVTITNDGLLTFKRVAGSEGGQLVPDLATSIPKPQNGGKSYTFQLRRGIRYSNGARVRASDIRRGLERFLALQRGPPLYGSIVGAAACRRQPARCDLRRGIAADDRAGRVTFELTGPDLDFLNQIALPFAAALPEGTPLRVADSAALRPATGPYMVKRFLPARRVELVRNPHFREWSRAAQPYGFPGRIVFDLTRSPDAQITAVQDDKADLASVFLSPPRLEQLTTRHAEQLHLNTRPQIFMMFLNTRVPPFDRVDVRRAVNYAVDRDEFIRRFLGRRQLQPTCQILPPNFPGYRPYCPYTRNGRASSATWTGTDVARAERLVRASGTRGTKVTIWSFRDRTVPDDTGVARYLAGVLARLGYRTSVTVVPDGLAAYLEAVQDSRNRAQIGSYGWVADYPAPSSFITTMLSCDAFRPSTPRQTNVAEFCDSSIDAAIDRARRLQATDPTAANALWGEIDRRLTDQAPFVVTSTAKDLGFVSKRVGNYQYNPQWGVLLSRLWVR